MLEFSLIEFITDDFDAFRGMTEERLPAIIESHYVHAEKDFNVIMKQKGVPDGDWESLLPATYAGFRRTVDPTCAVRIINGSYMVAAYYDGVTQSGLAVMYNFLRDDFSPNGGYTTFRTSSMISTARLSMNCAALYVKDSVPSWMKSETRRNTKRCKGAAMVVYLL